MQGVTSHYRQCSYLHDMPVPPRLGDHSLRIKTLADNDLFGRLVLSKPPEAVTAEASARDFGQALHPHVVEPQRRPGRGRFFSCRVGFFSCNRATPK
jgi:hypothetical protein